MLKYTRRRVNYEDLSSAYEACKDIARDERLVYKDWRAGNPVQQFHKMAKNIFGSSEAVEQ